MHACLSGHHLYLFCLKMTMRWCTPEEPVFRRPGHRQQTSSSVKAGEEGEEEGNLQLPVVFTPTSSVRLRFPTRSHVSHMDSATPVLLLRKLWPNFSLCSGKWLPVRKQSAFKVFQCKGLSWFVFLPSPPLQTHHYPWPSPPPLPPPREKAQSHQKASFLVPSCAGSRGLLERRASWSAEHSFLGSIWSADKQQRWILICLPSSKAIAYPKDDKYFNQCSACLVEVSLLLRDFPSFLPQTCPVHGPLPRWLGKSVIKSPSFVGEHIYFYDNCTLLSFSKKGKS